MKFSLISILFCLCTSLYAGECSEKESREHEAVTITLDSDPDSGMYHVRAPKEFEGKKLKLLILIATLNRSEGKEIALPLAIKSKGDITGSYFHMPIGWLSVKVLANYGEKLCVELISKTLT